MLLLLKSDIQARVTDTMGKRDKQRQGEGGPKRRMRLDIGSLGREKDEEGIVLAFSMASK